MYSKAKKTAQWAVTKMRSLSSRTAAPVEAQARPASVSGRKTPPAKDGAGKPAMAYQQGFTSGPMT
jgi:hypothetical protein